jgi:hypothetical protein
MSNYFCFVCNYEAKQKSNYLKHLKTKKHQKVVNSSEHLVNISEHLVNKNEHLVNISSEHLVNILEKSSKSEHLVNIGEKCSKSAFVCKYCNKSFTTNTSKYRHIRTVCKKSKDEDVNYIVELLNKKTDVLKNPDLNNQLEDKLEKMNQQINKMIKKLQITNISHHNNTIIQNFHVNDYNKPDLSHLTSVHYTKALKENNMCVAELIKMIHFDETKPENMSIYIPSLKDKYVCLVKDGTWMTESVTAILPTFSENNYYILREWIEENKDKLSSYMKKQFESFEGNFYKENMQEHTNKLIKYLLYDFRDIPKKQRKLT